MNSFSNICSTSQACYHLVLKLAPQNTAETKLIWGARFLQIHVQVLKMVNFTVIGVRAPSLFGSHSL